MAYLPGHLGKTFAAPRRIPRAGQNHRAPTRSTAAAFLITALLLGGCAGLYRVPTTVDVPGMPNPEEALQQSMQHVDAEMAELGRLSPTVAREVRPVM